MREHWRRFGRNFYTRYDYEELPAAPAKEIVEGLRRAFPALAGATVNGDLVASCDDFAYRDPVDGSLTEHQGLRVVFRSGARVVVRLSGTGTEGATLRLYVESYEPDPAKQRVDAQQALAPLVSWAVATLRIRELTGREGPTVVT